MRHLFRSIGGVAALSLLVACAQGPEDQSLEIEVGQVIRDQIKQRFGGGSKPQPPTLTRALLDSIEDPHIEVVIETEELRDYVTLQLARSDDLPGRIELWRTVDNISFGFRDGMLISTRGLRGGMLSAAVPADGQGAMGPASGGARLYEFRGDDSGSYRVRLACDLHDQGTVALDIVGRSYPTRYLQERCSDDSGSEVVNDYWIDARGGRVRQSRQWAGPSIGYIRTRQVVD
ncbi:YjbF family lipoprotein [Tritonibacter scottomollicae]|uniref:YjbF family lipoprotein n=1 Tax=Tritonibacter scottomollicae TaxID=483013 RepID=UPI003AA88578